MRVFRLKIEVRNFKQPTQDSTDFKPVFIDFATLNSALKAFVLFKGLQEKIMQSPGIQAIVTLSNRQKEILLCAGNPTVIQEEAYREYAWGNEIEDAERELFLIFNSHQSLFSSCPDDYSLAENFLNGEAKKLLDAKTKVIAQLKKQILNNEELSGAINPDLFLNDTKFFKEPCLSMELNYDYKGLYAPSSFYN